MVANPPDDPQLRPGDALGRFVLVRPLGRGSFAEVWLADERRGAIRRQVALKVLQGEPGQDDRLDGLLREARLCAAVSHPNVVDVHDVGRSGDRWWVAMEPVDGGDLGGLNRRLDDLGLSWPRSAIVDAGIQIARALEAAHTATGPEGEPLPIIHRDLKPGNVLLHPSGLLQVTDFGIARVLSEESHTGTGLVKGTRGYVAPEIWGGSRDFRPRVDLFALGCLLYALVTGQKLFPGSFQEVFARIRGGSAAADAAPARARFPRLGEVVEDLLQRDPELRYQEARAVIGDLEALQVPGAPGLRELMALLEAIERPGASPPSEVDLAAAGSDPDWAALRRRAGAVEPPAVTGPPLRAGPEPAPASESAPARRKDPSSRLWTGLALLVLALLILVLAGTRRGRDASEAPAVTPERAVAEVPDLPVAPPPSPARQEGPARRQPRTVATSAPAGPDRDPSPTTDAEEAPATTAAPEPPAAVTEPPEPPSRQPDPEPACLVFSSSPPGAAVWLDGEPTDHRAGPLGRGPGRTRASGRVTVGMGDGAAAGASMEVVLASGRTTRVSCDLTVGRACSATTSDAWSCP